MIFVYKFGFKVNLLPPVVGIIFFDVLSTLLNRKTNSNSNSKWQIVNFLRNKKLDFCTLHLKEAR